MPITVGIGLAENHIHSPIGDCHPPGELLDQTVSSCELTIQLKLVFFGLVFGLTVTGPNHGNTYTASFLRTRISIYGNISLGLCCSGPEFESNSGNLRKMRL